MCRNSPPRLTFVFSILIAELDADALHSKLAAAPKNHNGAALRSPPAEEASSSDDDEDDEPESGIAIEVSTTRLVKSAAVSQNHSPSSDRRVDCDDVENCLYDPQFANHRRVAQKPLAEKTAQFKQGRQAHYRMGDALKHKINLEEDDEDDDNEEQAK